MANPWEFLSAWARDNVEGNGFGNEDRAEASILAQQCLVDARAKGFREDAIIQAAKGDLQGFLYAEMESAANRELNRLVDRDKR